MKHLEVRRDEIINDFNKGLSYRNLAKHYNCSVNTIIRHLKKWGVVNG